MLVISYNSINYMYNHLIPLIASILQAYLLHMLCESAHLRAHPHALRHENILQQLKGALS